METKSVRISEDRYVKVRHISGHYGLSLAKTMDYILDKGISDIADNGMQFDRIGNDGDEDLSADAQQVKNILSLSQEDFDELLASGVITQEEAEEYEKLRNPLQSYTP